MATLYRSHLYRALTPGVLRWFAPLHVAIYRVLGGRLVDRLAQGRMPILLLSTVGRRSGRERTHPVGFVAEGGSWLVLGSNGALPRTPAWIFNIRSEPHVSVQLGRRRFAADASILHGPERESAWALVCDRYPFFTAYQTAITRQIEVVRLTKTSDRPSDGFGSLLLGGERLG